MPLAGLFDLTLELCVPAGDTQRAKEERRALAERLAGEALAWRDAFDEDGNPLWISLADREKQEESAEAQTVLPGGSENAAPRGTLRFDDATRKGMEGGRKKEIPARENPLFNALDAVIRRVTNTPRQEAALPAEPCAGRGGRRYGGRYDGRDDGRGAWPPPKPRLLAGLVRMLALGACLAVIYHVMVLKGWVKSLF